MLQTKVAKRYAKSLLDLSKERGEMEAIAADMKLLASVCEQNHDLAVLLSSPIIKGDKKFSILKKVFAGKMSDLSIAFFDIITRKGRESQLEAIAREYLRIHKEYKGIQTAIVTSAIGLDDELRAKVYRIIKESLKSEIELEERVDKSLIGGFVLRVGDKQYDASISNDIRQLKQLMIDSSYVRKN